MSRRRREVVAVLLGYGLLSVLATWPLVFHFGTHVPGSPWWGRWLILYDTPANLWNLWWFRHAVVDLQQSPFHCQHIFYPFGANLWFHTLAPLHGFLGTFLQGVFSLAATRNLILLLDLLASAGFAHLLARRLGLGLPGAFLAGAVYAFSPGVFGHLYVGHFELLSTFWMPAGLLLFLRLTDSPRVSWSTGMLLALVFIGAAYTSPYYALYTAELLAVAAIIHWRKAAQKGALGTLGLSLVTALLALSPMLRAHLGPDAPEGLLQRAADFDEFSGDFAGFLVPSYTHPFLAAPLKPLHERIYLTPVSPGSHRYRIRLPQETTVFLGVSVLGLSLFGLWRRRQSDVSVALPLGVAVVFGILCLGAQLKLYGIATGLPLPAGLLAHVPLLQSARAPGRHIVLVMLGMGILAGMGWEKLRHGPLRWGLLGVLALEYAAIPLPLFSAKVPEVYHRLARAPGNFAVLEIPLGAGDGLRMLGKFDGGQLYAQTVHGRPIVAGAVSRLGMGRWTSLIGSPIIGTLLDRRSLTAERMEEDRDAGPAFFARWHIQAVLIHPPARNGLEQRYLEHLLPITDREEFSDGSLLLWVGARPG